MPIPNLDTIIKKRHTVLTGAILMAITLMLFTYMTSLFAFISPSQSLRWNTTITSTYTQPYHPGDTVTVDGLLSEGDSYFFKGYYYFFTSPEDVTWFVNVIDPNNMPIWFEPGQIQNAALEQTIDTISFTLPSNAVAGTYTVKLVVWSDFLPDGETRTNIVGWKTFEVVVP